MEKKIQQEKLTFILHVTGSMQGVFSLFYEKIEEKKGRSVW